jgi:type II secretory pathway pseudopilin PulG
VIVTLAVCAVVLPPIVAVTSELVLVVSSVRASPLSLVSTVLCDNWPAVVEKPTGTPRSGLPPLSITWAMTPVVPPVLGTKAVSARMDTAPTAAAPTRISMSSDLLPPEKAPILAAPDWAPAMKRTVTWPFCVRASRGSMVPSDEVKVTTVPFCTAVPADSITTAVISVLPATGSTPSPATSRIVVLVGASNGTLSQAEPASAARSEPTSAVREMSDMWRVANDNSYVNLRGQGARTSGLAGDPGYVMVALLVAMSVMAVLMGVALPVWNKQAQREREEEYLFRAHEYARGILKFQRKAGPGTLPPTLDLLVEQRFVRRKYKDPLTGQDFQPVYQTAAPIGGSGGAAGAIGTGGGAATGGFGSTSTAGSGTGFGSTSTSSTGGTSTTSQTGAMPGAPVIGVVSKSKGTSIKIYNGRTRYDQWAVTWQDVRPGKGLPPDILQAMNQAGAAGGAGNIGGAAGGTGNPLGGAGGANPFGQPGTGNPFGQPIPQPGANPFGAPATNPFQGGGSRFTPTMPPPPGQTGASPFGPPPPRKQ